MPRPALAQAQAPVTTRAEASRAAREQKQKSITPYNQGRVESWLYRFEDRYFATRIFNPRQGLFARLGGLPQGAGFSAGPAYRVARGPVAVTASGVHSIRGYWDADVNGRVALTPTWDAGLTIGFKRRHLAHEDFFGIGPASADGSRSAYRLDEEIGYIHLDVAPAKWMKVGFLGEHRGVTPGRGEDPRVPSVQDLFDVASLPGFDASPDFLTAGARVVLDFTDRSLGAPAGGEYIFAWDRTADRGADRFEFDRWTVDLRQYIPVVSGARTLVVRALARGVSPRAGADVPFYDYPALGGSNTLRGLPSYRLRDRHALLGQIEYRFEINEFLTGALFYDAGRVGPDARSLFRGRFEQDGGFGLRFGFSTQVFLRTEIVYGSRGAKALVRFSDVF